jgi:hypothetical protein
LVVAKDIPYLIETSESKKQELLPILRECGGFIGSPEVVRRKLSDFRDSWRDHKMSSFDYIGRINFLAGRFFNDSNSYPVFPSLQALSEEVASLNRPEEISDDLLKFVENEKDNLGCVPERYFFPEAGFDVQDVYERRKLLEVSQRLPVWIDRVFNAAIYAGKTGVVLGPLQQDQASRTLLEKGAEKDALVGCDAQSLNTLSADQRIIFCASYDSLNFVMVLETGKIVFWSEHIDLEFIPSPPSVLDARESPLTAPLSKWSFSTTKIGLWAYDHQTVLLLGVGPDLGVLVTKYEGVYLETPQICGRLLKSSNTAFRRIDQKMPLFFEVPAKIVCFASSPEFNIIAVGCQDSKLRIRDYEQGSKLKTASLDGEIPVKILVTEKWGFIVVQTLLYWFVFSVNGLRLKKVRNEYEVCHWAQYHTADGFDFITFCDRQGVYHFEALYPERVKQAFVMEPLRHLQADSVNGWFVFVTAARVLVMSIPELEMDT